MVAVLARNRGRIHSMSDFSNALGCVPRPVTSASGRSGGRSGAPHPRPPASEGRAAFVSVGRAAGPSARAALSRAAGAWPKALARARLDQALALRKTFSYLASRSAQRRIARKSDRAQVKLIFSRQRGYIRKLRAIAVRTLKQGHDHLPQQGDAAGPTCWAGPRSAAGRGDLGVLQAVGIPLPAPRQSGPSPAGIDVIDVGGAAPGPPGPGPHRPGPPGPPGPPSTPRTWTW